MFKHERCSATVVLTVAYPQSDEYIDAYFKSLESQSDLDFDILIVNDGLENLKLWRDRFTKLKILELPGRDNIAKNRELLINSAFEMGYINAVFADFDDYFSSDRVYNSKKQLENHSIVVNDLALVGQDGNVFNAGYFKGHLSDQEQITSDHILEFNFLGMSNSSIKLIDITPIDIPDNLKAVDWYIFSKLLQKNKGVYLEQSKTYYRQHTTNISNILSANLTQLLSELEVKRLHYSLLLDCSKKYMDLLSLVNEFMSLEDEAHKLYLSKIKQPILPFWWSLFDSNRYQEVKDAINR